VTWQNTSETDVRRTPLHHLNCFYDGVAVI
jgi:hypothetical protein